MEYWISASCPDEEPVLPYSLCQNYVKGRHYYNKGLTKRIPIELLCNNNIPKFWLRYEWKRVDQAGEDKIEIGRDGVNWGSSTSQRRLPQISRQIRKFD